MSAPQFTPGPWLMAAIPSSIVGWPVVAPHAQGRVVCKINYADRAAFGGPQPGDRAFNAESKANARLIAAAPELYAALWHLVNINDDADTCMGGLADCRDGGNGPVQSPELALVISTARRALAKARGEQA